MKSIALQIDHIKGKIHTQEYVLRSRHYRGEIDDDLLDTFKSILDSLERLKAQEDLIDQQADECNGITDDHLDLLDRADEILNSADKTAAAYLNAQPNTILEAITKEIAEIKLMTKGLCNKFGIKFVDEKSVTESITQDNAIAKLMPVDPAIILLLGGNPSELPGHKLLVVSSELEHDIELLKYTRRQKLTSTTLYAKLSEMHYKTDDLDLLVSAYTLIQSYLPF